MMGTQRKADQGVIQSSIALLQERFKQLQRVKEMREKRELLRMFSDQQQTSTITTTTTTINSNSNSNNSNKNSPSDSINSNKFWSDPHHNDIVYDELQVFLPPNYYNYNNQKPSSCHSPSSPLPSSQKNISHNQYNLSEVSLSLWPTCGGISSSRNNNNTSTDHFQRTNFDATLSVKDISRPCVSSAFKFEETRHVPDVDTTLHL